MEEYNQFWFDLMQFIVVAFIPLVLPEFQDIFVHTRFQVKRRGYVHLRYRRQRHPLISSNVNVTWNPNKNNLKGAGGMRCCLRHAGVP